jgi:uncharacterized damage-inducible protein DinB
MKISSLAATVALSVVPALALAQVALNPVADALRSVEQRQARNLIAAAEAFPADKYGYKPTAAQMSVAEIVVHLAEGNDQLCSALGSTAAPQRSAVTAATPREALIARLRESFQFCETGLAGLTDVRLGEMVPMFGRQVTRGNAVLVTVADWADHYSQLAIYLRLNNLLPPTAQRRPGM